MSAALTLFDGGAPTVHPARPVLAADRWQTNADLIVDVARLGYLRPEWRTLDPTYGRGIWWKRWRPDELVCHDRDTLDGVDFRHLPHGDGSFDAAVFDPPYVLMGGRETTTRKDEWADRFGLITAPKTRADLESLIRDGFTDVHRVVRPRGHLLVKCKDEISSGHLWSGSTFVINHAATLGARLTDRFLFVTAPGPTPWNYQLHARRNYSELLVFTKGVAS